MNTAGAVGTSGAWRIMFTPWGPSCWAARPGSHSYLPPPPLRQHLALRCAGGRGGAFPSDFLLLPSRLTGSSVSAGRRLALGVSVEQEESTGTLEGLKDLGSVTNTMTSA